MNDELRDMPRTSPRRLGRVLPGILLAVYAPSAWLLFEPLPWSGFHWSWIRLFPVLPGLIFPAWILTHDADGPLGIAIAATSTVLFVTGLVLLGLRSRSSFWLAFAIGLGLMVLNAFAERSAYLM